ncbi:hypothetical protein JZ751_027117 [Albula glossodonta]|uniref:Uncharacterized protein n=1 Tax=Albula glossodonta TaxID=121402 RepID=A0A8T2NDV1_9TELE|nr:hypothetical protein JZ751_027117 [Albula glossodonta]
MKSVCLTTMPVEERHMASNIVECLEPATAGFEIPLCKIIAIMHDNGANIVIAASILEEKQGWSSDCCTGHTLVINFALKGLWGFKMSCGVFYFFKVSQPATNREEQMGTPEHKLVQNVSMRWNSTFCIVSRLLEQRWQVTAMLSDSSTTQAGKR